MKIVTINKIMTLAKSEAERLFNPDAPIMQIESDDHWEALNKAFPENMVAGDKLPAGELTEMDKLWRNAFLYHSALLLEAEMKKRLFKYIGQTIVDGGNK